MRTTPTPISAKLEQVALRAARAAGRIHLQRLSRIRITRKTNALDLVTEADRESEQALIRTLTADRRGQIRSVRSIATGASQERGLAGRLILRPAAGKN
jgi:hypothetical protein